VTFLNLSLRQPVVRVADTTTAEFGGIGARFLMEGAPSDGRFSLVEHPIVPRGLAAPMHRHTREDEYSFVLAGTWGFQLADEVVYAGPGDLVYKPRDVWHTFWNAGDEPARLLEVISPAGFEHFFVELAAVLPTMDPDDPAPYVELTERYGLEMDFDSVPRLAAAHGLVVDEIDQRMVED